MTRYKAIAIDLAKTKFHLATLEPEGKLALKQQVMCDELLSYIMAY